MFDHVVTALVVLLGVHAVAKFAFFAVPYPRRRAALDKQYGDKDYAGATADPALMAFTVVISLLVVLRGVEGVSFLAGLWIGASIIQLFFHQFHRWPTPERAAPEPTSPLKHLSYAVQDAPWRTWPQMALMSVLVVIAIVDVVRTIASA